MASVEDVRRLSLALPNTSEGTHFGHLAWRVEGKAFAWERPLRKADLAALGDRAPAGAVLGLYVEHEGAKFALIETDPRVFFTTPHFDGYPAVLVELDNIGVTELAEVLEDAWLARAPKKLVKQYLSGR